MLVKNMNKLIIVGASGHGKVIADIASKSGYTDIAFLDDNPSVKKCMGYPVIGSSNSAPNYMDGDFIVAIGNPQIRENIQNKLVEIGLHIVSLIHPRAVIGEKVEIGVGSVIMAGTVINSDSKIGQGCIINTGASVDHDNVIEDFVHVSVGSHLAGTVQIGKRTWIGAGAIVNNNVNICSDCMIGSGAVVLKDIQEKGTYIGVPSKRLIKCRE